MTISSSWSIVNDIYVIYVTYKWNWTLFIIDQNKEKKIQNNQQNEIRQNATQNAG